MYELFVLGELTLNPKHGYDIQFMLNHTFGPIRQISNGTLYPLISKLVENGCIHQRNEPQEGGRPRKIYEITDIGRQRFLELMQAPLEYNTDIDLQLHLKMTFFGYVPKEIRLAALEQYLEYQQFNLKSLKEWRAQAAVKPEIPETKRTGVLQIYDHRIRGFESEIEWANQAINRIEAEEA